MMVIRGVDHPTPTAFTGIHTFVSTGGRVFAPDAALRTALAGRRIVSLSQNNGSITFRISGTNAQAAFNNAALPHIHFDDQNNLILDADYNPLLRIRAGDTAVVQTNVLMTVPTTIAYHIYPADRCTWRQTYDNNSNEYLVYDATFYPGNATGVTIDEAQLGYIGKSGRFVGIAG